MNALETLLFAGLAGIGGLILISALSDLISLVRREVSRAPGTSAPNPLLLLIPAHDEERVIERTLDSLAVAAKAIDVPHEAVVVADNCSDRTAELARSKGATVLERVDPTNPGKPSALQWALEQLDVGAERDVVIIDADLVMDEDFLEEIVDNGPWTGRAGQPRQRIAPSSLDSRHGRLLTIMVDARYRVGIALKRRVGLNSPCTGAAFVLGGDIARSIPWRELGPTEDLEIYTLLTAQGRRVDALLETSAYIEAEPSLGRSKNQRRRWAGGRWRAAAVRTVPTLLGRSSWHQKMDALGELWTPGPVEHLLIAGLGTALGWLALPPTQAWIITGLFGAGLLRPIFYAAMGIRLQPAPGRALLEFIYLPAYMLWRAWILATTLPVALRGTWSKTPRS